MSIVTAVFLFLALVVPGGYQGISFQQFFGVIWFVLFVLEKTGYLKLP
jgi:hypothetical protein